MQMRKQSSDQYQSNSSQAEGGQLNNTATDDEGERRGPDGRPSLSSVTGDGGQASKDRRKKRRKSGLQTKDRGADKSLASSMLGNSMMLIDQQEEEKKSCLDKIM